MACVAIKLNEDEQAKMFAEKTLSISEPNEFRSLSLVAETVLADTLLLKKKYDEGIAKYYSLIPQIEAINRDDMLKDAYEHLQNAYEQQGNFKAAYEMGLKLAEVNARILSVERTKVINTMQVRFETEKKESALRELKIKSETLQRRKVEAELESLRSRINPHFVYNVMSTIQGLVRLNKTNEAIEAIERFALLNRLTLEHSSSNEVTVEQEIQLLSNYIETEKLLMQSDFTYQIGVDENIEADFTSLPSLLVQPFVENAIKHGLMNSKRERILSIDFKLEDNCLKVKVKDNGIGRNHAEYINQSLTNKPKSFATSAIAMRLALLNESRKKPIEIFTHDLFDNLQQPNGTEVVILVPIENE
jgi:LytS/YehU family sensor histidine kinase